MLPCKCRELGDNHWARRGYLVWEEVGPRRAEEEEAALGTSRPSKARLRFGVVGITARILAAKNFASPYLT